MDAAHFFSRHGTENFGEQTHDVSTSNGSVTGPRVDASTRRTTGPHHKERTRAAPVHAKLDEMAHAIQRPVATTTTRPSRIATYSFSPLNASASRSRGFVVVTTSRVGRSVSRWMAASRFAS